MPCLPILFFPHPSLRQSAKTVADVDDDLRRLADDMRETMKLAKGIAWRTTSWPSPTPYRDGRRRLYGYIG